MKEEGNETETNCHGLKMLAPDGKMRLTDVADTKQLFRLIQSIFSIFQTKEITQRHLLAKLYVSINYTKLF